MNSTTHLWQGRSDGDNAPRFHEKVLCSLPPEASEGSIALIGFACDEGIKRNQGRTGASEGPASFRKALSNIPWHSTRDLYDIGDITCSEGNLEAAQATLAKLVNDLHKRHIRTFVIGGGHELAWGHFQGLPNHTDRAIINFDSHFDLRPLLPNNRGTSGTSFTQIANHFQKHNQPFRYICIGIQQTANTTALFETAKQLNTQFITADSFQPERALDLLDEVISKHDSLYVSLCLDFFAAPFAPGVSAPQPLGLLPHHLIPLLQKLASSGKVAAFNIAELSPPHDPQGITALLAAQLFALFFESWK